MEETIPIPLDDDVLGYLKCPEGLIILRKSIPESFAIARQFLAMAEKKLEKEDVE